MLLLIALLVSTAVGLPQKVVFIRGREGSEEGCPGRHLVRANGECFTVGEQGPCELGKLLDRTGGCVETEVTTTTNTMTTTLATSTSATTTMATTTLATTTMATVNELGCPGDKIPFEGGCHQLASTGPCNPGHWLLLVEVKEDKQVVAECQERKCQEETEVWWQPSCSCLGNSTLRSSLNPCEAEEGQLMVNPYGQGICSYPATKEQGNFKTRIFENIPVNDETAFSRATLLNCYVDEANNCRRIFTLGPQPAQNQARNAFADTSIESTTDTIVESADSLIEWLDKFEKPGDGECSPAGNEDDIVETA